MDSMKRKGVLAVVTAATILLGLVVTTWAQTENLNPRTDTMDPVKQSICIYRAILDDVEKTYKMPGGGGIGAIIQTTTTTFVVHISQEERKDLINYEVKVGPRGQVEIINRTESTKSY